jgi:hypothetical protein
MNRLGFMNYGIGIMGGFIGSIAVTDTGIRACKIRACKLLISNQIKEEPVELIME